VKPPAHELHVAAPVLAWNLPATHAVQGVPVPEAAVPMGQLTHAAWEAPPVVAEVPWGQFEQPDAPALE